MERKPTSEVNTEVGFDLVDRERSAREYIEQRLNGEEGSMIAEPMNSSCRVAVIIPVYNETYTTVVRTLAALANQTAEYTTFEVDIVVNNDRTKSSVQTAEYERNQKIIQLLKYIKTGTDIPNDLPEDTLAVIEKIRTSKLQVHCIDKSTEKNASEVNNVGAARNRAAAEIASRFTEIEKLVAGIIASTDCDTIVSQNYIEELIKIFNRGDVAIVAGQDGVKIDPTEVYPDLSLTEAEKRSDMLKKLYDLVSQGWVNNASVDVSVAEGIGEVSEANHFSGSNMAFSALNYGVVQGIPELSSHEDTEFAKKLIGTDLGKALVSSRYSVLTEMRTSERTDEGFGQNIKNLKQLVDDYATGKTLSIELILDNQVGSFLKDIRDLFSQGFISVESVLLLMKKYNFKSVNNELAFSIELQTIIVSDNSLSEESKLKFINLIKPFFPTRDITHQIIG